MKVLSVAAALQSLREQPLWRLLAADKAPVTIALMHSLLFENEKALTSSILVERLGRALEQLRAQGYDLPQAPQAYVSDWLNNRWLSRHLPPGANEEELTLTPEAANALRFIAGTLAPRTVATESRLAAVIQQVVRLAEETDPDSASRIEALLAERARIDREIDTVREKGVTTLPDERAVERAREIIALTDELGGDFRNVRDGFDHLNRSLRRDLIENLENRGEILSALFAGVDLIGESEAGRTFNAFWRLLTDAEQSARLSEALDDVVRRPFARRLKAPERKFLQNLTAMLIDEGGGVHDILQSFARSLKSFVQSREYQEQRRLHELLKRAQSAAIAMKDQVHPNQALDYSLTLTSSRVRSVSQWSLFDPQSRMADQTMEDASPAHVSLDLVEAMIRQSEIDFRTLRDNVRAMLGRSSQVSIGQVLAVYPAEQGLGSLVGYVALGAKHGEVADGTEVVRWLGRDEVPRAARIPAIYFVKERAHELDS